MVKLMVFNKPYQVLSQFTDSSERMTLQNFISTKGIYPAGRLDYDSEGLMLLTDNGKLQSLISHPKHKLRKKYWAQVEGIADKSHCNQLLEGVQLNDGMAKAISCKPINPPLVWSRNPPIRVRVNVPDSWIELELHEGRNRQVRRMTAAVGLPTLRLIRAQIGNFTLQQLQPGDHKTITGQSVNAVLSKLRPSKIH